MSLVSPAVCPAGVYYIASIPHLLPDSWKEIAENTFGASNVVYGNVSEYEDTLVEGNYQTSDGVDYAIMLCDTSTFIDVSTGAHVHADNSHVAAVLASGVEQKVVGTKTWLGGGATLYIDSATPTIIRRPEGHGVGIVMTSTSTWVPVRKVGTYTSQWSQTVSAGMIVFDSVSLVSA